MLRLCGLGLPEPLKHGVLGEEVLEAPSRSRRTGLDLTETPAVGELVSEDAGGNPGRSGTRTPMDAAAPRASCLLPPALGTAATPTSVSDEVNRKVSTQTAI